MSREQILNNLMYHPPILLTVPQHEETRQQILSVALDWEDRLPDGRHKALAQTALQEAMMWANAAIACDTPREA